MVGAYRACQGLRGERGAAERDRVRTGLGSGGLRESLHSPAHLHEWSVGRGNGFTSAFCYSRSPTFGTRGFERLTFRHPPYRDVALAARIRADYVLCDQIQVAVVLILGRAVPGPLLAPWPREAANCARPNTVDHQEHRAQSRSTRPASSLQRGPTRVCGGQVARRQRAHTGTAWGSRAGVTSARSRQRSRRCSGPCRPHARAGCADGRSR